MDTKIKNRVLILVGIFVVAVVCFFAFQLFFSKNEPITFKEKYNDIEYGETVALKDTIEKVDPENAKIKFPDVELKEVGTYYLTFLVESDGKEIEQEKEFVVKDTAFPKITLKNEKTVEVPLNKQYDLFANVKEYKNLSDAAKQDKVAVDEKTFKATKKQIEKQEEVIANREIRSKKDIKENKIKNNYILYTTNYDVTKEGTYTITALAVDENYHSEQFSWKIKVVPNGQLVNSGGLVTCTFNKDELQTSKAYETSYLENYIYDENLLVSKLEFVTQMQFNEDYNTTDNMQSLIDAIDKKYGSYKDKEGISVNVTTSNDSVITTITVDFNTYSVKEDPLQLLESKKNGKVKMASVIDKLKEKAVCEIK